MTTPSALSGCVFEIQRFSIHDGPGIRTTVFMKGCPLRCAWCHNPESISPRPQLSFLPDKCIGCGYCFRVCPQHGHALTDNRHTLRRDACVVCGSCTKECYAGALELVGRETTVAAVIEEVLRDQPFYETSGGGLTLSGGEPTLQIDFSEALLQEAKRHALHACVETCGFCEYGRLERLAPLVDLWLYDWKESDPDRHREFTGVSHAPIRDNLRRLHAAGARLRLRCPIIPGLNDRPDHFAGIAALSRELPGIEGVEVMPYHRLGESKKDRLGLERSHTVVTLGAERDDVRGWIRALREQGVPVYNATDE